MGHKTKTVVLKTRKHSELRGTAEMGDNSLWVHLCEQLLSHYTLPFGPLWLIDIKIFIMQLLFVSSRFIRRFHRGGFTGNVK